MARYYGEVKGRAATRGHRIANDKLTTRLNSPQMGLFCEVEPDPGNPAFDIIKIYLTRGTQDPGAAKLVGIVMYLDTLNDYGFVGVSDSPTKV
jgi:hypothetical protein